MEMAFAVQFNRLAIIGFGMIGASVALAARAGGVVREITGGDIDPDVCAYVEGRRMAKFCTSDLMAAVQDADLVMLCVPVGAYATVFEALRGGLKPGCVISDVGSVKQAVVDQILPLLPAGVHFIPGHPIAGLEKHGPSQGNPQIFHQRWTTLCPFADSDPDALARLSAFWEGCGAQVALMDAAHHDRVLALTSHLPQLIARTIVGTAADLEAEMQDEVIKFSAGGFRDFTRMAAADPIMWRDVFLHNSEAVLEMIQRLQEDLAAMQKAIRSKDGEVLRQRFSRAQVIRQKVLDARQG